MGNGMVKRQTESGFTLVELMVVMLIVALLTAAMVKMASVGIDEGKRSATETFIKQLSTSVSTFKGAFAGQGVVPDRWPGGDDFDFSFEIGDMFPGGAVELGDDERLDNSSQLLLFWLAHRLRAWRRPHQDAPWDDAEGHLFGPYIEDLNPSNLGIPILLRTDGGQRERVVQDFLDYIQVATFDLTDPSISDPEDSREENRIWEMDINLTADLSASEAWTECSQVVLVDSWGNPLRYLVLPDKHAPHRFFIVSAGPDERWNTDDDIPKSLVRADGSSNIRVHEDEVLRDETAP